MSEAALDRAINSIAKKSGCHWVEFKSAPKEYKTLPVSAIDEAWALQNCGYGGSCIFLSLCFLTPKRERHLLVPDAVFKKHAKLTNAWLKQGKQISFPPHLLMPS